MSNVTETCSCGGTFSGDSYYAIGWRSEHKHEFAPTPEPQQATDDRVADQTGYLIGSGDIETGLGFVGPGPKLGDE